jgi:hypothetical protein
LIFWSSFSVLHPVGDVNEVLDLLEGQEIDTVDQIFILPPEGDDSDGYDESDTEEGQAVSISRTILQVHKETVE